MAMHGPTPSQLPVERTPAREREFTEARSAVERGTVKLRDAITNIEEAWQNLKVLTEGCAVIEAGLSGRAMESCRDQRLGPERQRMHELLRRLGTAL